jgi:hypothetical protein
MKNLNQVSLRDLKEDGNYLVHQVEYERFGDSESYLLNGSGKEVLKFVKEHVNFYEDEDINDLYNWFDENNGDGDDLLSIFELENK